MGLREDKKKATAHQILAIAAKHFLEVSYDDVKLADISREAGIAEGTLFNYFHDKTTLFLSAFSKAVVTDKSPLVFQSPNNGQDGIKVIIDALEYYLRIDEPRLRQVFRSFYHHQKGQLLKGDSKPYDELEALTAPLYMILNDVVKALVRPDQRDVIFQIIKWQIEGIYEAYLYHDWPFATFIAETRKHLGVLMTLPDIKYS